MATEVKRRRGTTDQHNGTNGETGFTGAVAELTVDLDKNTVVVHDGATQGGFPLLREDFDNVPTTAPFTNISLDTAIFDTAYTETESETQGTLYWNSDEETLSLVTNGSTLELGHKTELHVKVTQTGGVSRGDVVAATGAVGGSGKIEVQKFSAGTSPTKTIVGIMDEDVAQGEFGKAIAFGKIRGLDMSAFSEGDILYASTTAGELTGTEPTAGNVSLPIAYVVDNSVNNGEIFVRITPIDENAYQDYDAGLADIAGLTPTDSNFIVGNGTNWVAESGDTARLSLGVGSTDSPTFGGLTVNGSITVTGNVDGRDVSADGAELDELYTTIGLSSLTSNEVDQLENIGSTTISATQWGYLGVLDQNLRTTDAVTFSTVDTGQGANELYAMNQDVQTTDDVTFNILSISDSITDASTTYVAGITGVGTIYDMDNGNGSFFEVDNMRVRNEMRVHIFKKDIVKASNAYLFITDSAEVAKTTTITDNTGTFRVVDDGTNASFEHGDLLWAKNLQDNGTLQAEGVKIEVSVQPKFVWDNSEQVWNADPSIAFSGYGTGFTSGIDEDSGKPYVEYNVYAVEDEGTLNAGDTIVRVSGGNILNDASSSQSPFIDIYDGVTEWSQFQDVSKTKVRLGNLAGVSNASGFGLFTENAFLTGSLVVGDLTKVGQYMEFDGSTLTVKGDVDITGTTIFKSAKDGSTTPTNLGEATFIDGGTIVTNSITATEIDANTITANEIAAGTITATEIDVADLFAQDATVAGTLTIGQGGSFVSDVINFDDDSFLLYASTVLLSSSGTGKIALGTDADNILPNDGVGFYADGSGNFLVGSIGQGSDSYISFNGTSITIKTDAFDLATSTLVINSANNKVALGASANAITIDGTEVGFIVDGNGEFKAYADANNYIRLADSAIDIKAESFDLETSTIVLNSAGSGTLIVGADADNQLVDDGVGFFVTGSGDFRVGTIQQGADSYITFDGTTVSIVTDTFDLESGNLHIDSEGTTFPSASSSTADSTSNKSAWSNSSWTSDNFAINDKTTVKFQFDYDITSSGEIQIALFASTDGTNFTAYSQSNTTAVINMLPDFADNSKSFATTGSPPAEKAGFQFSISNKINNRIDALDGDNPSGGRFRTGTVTLYIYIADIGDASHIRFQVFETTTSLPVCDATNIITQEFQSVTELNPSGVFTRLSDAIILANGDKYLNPQLIT